MQGTEVLRLLTNVLAPNEMKPGRWQYRMARNSCTSCYVSPYSLQGEVYWLRHPANPPFHILHQTLRFRSDKGYLDIEYHCSVSRYLFTNDGRECNLRIGSCELTGLDAGFDCHHFVMVAGRESGAWGVRSLQGWMQVVLCACLRC